MSRVSPVRLMACTAFYRSSHVYASFFLSQNIDFILYPFFSSKFMIRKRKRTSSLFFPLMGAPNTLPYASAQGWMFHFSTLLPLWRLLLWRVSAFIKGTHPRLCTHPRSARDHGTESSTKPKPTMPSLSPLWPPRCLLWSPLILQNDSARFGYSLH